MLSFGGSGERLINAITSDSPTINHKIMIGLFTGLDPLNPSSLPTNLKMYEIGYANTRYFVYDLRKEGTYVVYFFIKDLLKNGGT
jgi:hypothetical protein